MTTLDEATAKAIYERSLYILVTLDDREHAPSPVRVTPQAEDWIISAGYYHNVHHDWWEVPQFRESIPEFCERIRPDVVTSAAPKG